nr:unnamed protein product [Callosobruchus analis]
MFTDLLLEARMYLTQEELEHLARTIWDEDDDGEPIDFTDESEGEDEEIEQENHNSDSEQSADEDGHNPLGASAKTKAKNIIKTFPGPTRCARETLTELSSFSLCTTEEMISNIVKFPNIYIENKKIKNSVSKRKELQVNYPK